MEARLSSQEKMPPGPGNEKEKKVSLFVTWRKGLQDVVDKSLAEEK